MNFLTKKELEDWMYSMIPQDMMFLGFHASSYSKDIREIEANLRPLWGVFPAVFSDRDFAENPLVKKFTDKVKNHALPEVTTKRRQIAVEMPPIAYAMSRFGSQFLALFSPAELDYLVSWLNQINEIELPKGNWYFFRVLINATLKSQSLAYSEEKLIDAIAIIDDFYLGDGWYSDGKNEQRDYYVAFAFHFYGLLCSRILDDKQAKIYQLRAVLFAKDFQYWFDDSGRSLPFGRSLTYRFAHAAFWSAFLVTGVYKQSNFSLGQIKRLILQNFRFWQKTLTENLSVHTLPVGYAYGNLLLSEDYNAPGSPMWAFKTFILFELSATDDFWNVKEEVVDRKEKTYQQHAGFLVSTDKNQTVALSARQYSNNPLLYHQQEKYSKFAYSTYFGFNLTHDILGIENFAIDSTLAISTSGANQFCARHKVEVFCGTEQYLYSEWSIGKLSKIKTYLIPVSASQHIRIHQITNQVPIDVYEGGFPLMNWNKKEFLADISQERCFLSNAFGQSGIQNFFGHQKPVVVPQGPNTNLYSAERNGVPCLFSTLEAGCHILASSVFASPSKVTNKALSVEPIGESINVRFKNQIFTLKF